MNIPILMYHALFPNNQNSVSGADIHYAISDSVFKNHLEIIAKNRNGISVLELLNKIDEENSKNSMFNKVGLTFDDGHITNYSLAYPILKEMNFSADFFINSINVATKNFVDWHHLREMAENRQSIQSHGHSHIYFDQLSPDETRFQLETSKKTIEDKIGLPVLIFAPPGGRLSHFTWDIAQDLGYKAITSSRPGVWRNQQHFSDIPRFAILNATLNNTVRDWIENNFIAITKTTTKYQCTYLLKKLLGNKYYEKLRSTLLN